MKTAVITGASGGIGSATVKEFIKNGYFVAGLYNKDDKGINALKKELTSQGLADYFVPISADLSVDGQLDFAVKRVFENFNHVDVLVNNAGVELYKLITETTKEDLYIINAVNSIAPYMLSKAVLPAMIERKKGVIINVSSIWGEVGASMETAYSMTKASLIGLTKALAKEVAPSGVRVNCVCPGAIDTKMNQRFSLEEKEEIISQIPLSRMGTAKEIGELIYFLSSDTASYITGQIITADGGFTL